jgi:DNA-binding MurR/RpiR family transcriptional regulator
MKEMPTILRHISDLYPELSASHQQIVDLILREPETSAFYNVAELARAANVSDATVTRFARAIGYSGFPELSRQLQSVVRMRLTTRERLERTVQEAGHDNLLSQSIEEDVQNLQMFLDDLDIDNLETCARQLIDSRTIGIVCSRSTLALGLFFQFYLNFLRKETVLIDGDPRSIDRLTHLDKEHDMVVGFGFSRYSQFTVNSIRYLQQKQLPIYVVTDYPSSPLVQEGTKAFYCPTGIASHMDSLVAPLALLQALLRRMSAELYDSTRDELSRLEEVWKLFSVYHKTNHVV